MNSDEFGSTFWLTLTGVISAFISGALVYAIKSKCSRCSVCFGLIDIHRDVALEVEEQKFEIEKGLNFQSSDDDTTICGLSRNYLSNLTNTL
jgi:hypothetical protein